MTGNLTTSSEAAGEFRGGQVDEPAGGYHQLHLGELQGGQDVQDGEVVRPDQWTVLGEVQRLHGQAGGQRLHRDDPLGGHALGDAGGGGGAQQHGGKEVQHGVAVGKAGCGRDGGVPCGGGESSSLRKRKVGQRRIVHDGFVQMKKEFFLNNFSSLETKPTPAANSPKRKATSQGPYRAIKPKLESGLGGTGTDGGPYKPD